MIMSVNCGMPILNKNEDVSGCVHAYVKKKKINVTNLLMSCLLNNLQNSPHWRGH